MAQVCINCGKKINFFSNDPLLLDNDCLLCFDCSKTIKNEINNLYSVKNMDEFYSIKDKILDFCKKNYDDAVTNMVHNKITEISNYSTLAELQKFEKRKSLVKNYMLTTGYEFSGYYIEKYVGIVSGQIVLGTGFLSDFSASIADFFGEESNRFADKLETAKNAAIEKMILKSDGLGGNAIIGVDFDYITFHGNMIGVVANGTSVIIKKHH